jgi:homoserine O-succinyltransferase
MAETSGFLALQNEAMTGGGAAGTVTVALVNAMSDAALAITERRFSRLLHSALPGCQVTLRCVTLPEITRGEMAAARIARFYTTLADIVANPPDAVIFSGAEPRTCDLQDEAFWPSLTALFDWVQLQQVPSLFSCLAAHAAVLHFSGVRRRRLARKVSGMFAQSPVSDLSVQAHSLPPHPLLRGLPATFQVAHSRWNELDAADLEAAGYHVLTRGPETAVDMFAPTTGGLQIFLQGHPEYEESALAGEYRRDLRRFASGETSVPPEPPKQAPGHIAGSGFAEQCAGTLAPPGQSFADIFIRNWIFPQQEMTQ